ncbi:MAG TPA: ABC transporter permease [Bacteroidia bacterium]|nr:ABC transporter permease [Bacteroidia bacterium]
MALLLKENIKVATDSIKGNKLRAFLTMLIIFFGITALVGISSAIDAMKGSINSNFTSMGANSFTIRNRDMNVRVGRHGKRAKKYQSITYKEAIRFKEEFTFPVTTAVSTMASFNARLKFESEKTNPNIQVFGGDENYLETSGYELEKGRNFSPQEIISGSHMVIIGKDVEFALFKGKQKALDKFVTINGGKYKVIGVLASKGNSMGFGGDKVCIIPLTAARQYFSKPDMSFTISVLAKNSYWLELALGEANGLFRKIRRVPLGEDDNFEIVRADSLASMLIGLTSKASMGAIIIGIITLIGASIGLMNIMLVSVTERTKEIGLRKALGATAQTIKNQFLIESVVICVSGGFFGILMGIIAANLISFNLSSSFFMPWTWIIIGFTVCLIVGLISGYIPAKRASLLDPIESLRFE